MLILWFEQNNCTRVIKIKFVKASEVDHGCSLYLRPLAAQIAGFRVKAQPMVKDEQAELWRPVNTQHIDPLSNVTLQWHNNSYEVVAHRIADDKVRDGDRTAFSWTVLVAMSRR